MSIARSVAKVLRDHVVLELEAIDRMYLNVYVPHLQTVGAVVGYLRVHRGQRFASTTAVLPMTEAHLDADPQSAYSGSQEVAASTLDTLVREQHLDPARTAFKIDVQGYESAVLDGATDRGPGTIDVAVVDEDESAASARVRDVVTRAENVRAHDAARKDAEDQVRHGALHAVVRVPEGFGAKLGTDEARPLELAVDPARKLETVYLRAVLAEAFMRADPDGEGERAARAVSIAAWAIRSRAIAPASVGLFASASSMMRSSWGSPIAFHQSVATGTPDAPPLSPSDAGAIGFSAGSIPRGAQPASSSAARPRPPISLVMPFLPRHRGWRAAAAAA